MISSLLEEFIMADATDDEKVVFILCEWTAGTLVYFSIEQSLAGKTLPGILLGALAILFAIAGVKWPAIKMTLGARFASIVERNASNPLYRRTIYAVIAVVLLVSVGAKVYNFYRIYVNVNIAAPQSVHKPLHPPDYAFKKLRVVVPKPVPKHVANDLKWSKIAKGLEEPEGAPGSLVPHKGSENESRKEESRLNSMSLTQIRALIAGTIEKLEAFESNWGYPQSEELDTPPDQFGNGASTEESEAYKKRLAAKQKLEEDIRPTKRAKDFHKQFPHLATDVQYWSNKWPDIKAPPENECFPTTKMRQGAAQACAEYLKQVLDKYPRPQ